MSNHLWQFKGKTLWQIVAALFVFNVIFASVNADSHGLHSHKLNNDFTAEFAGDFGKASENKLTSLNLQHSDPISEKKNSLHLSTDTCCIFNCVTGVLPIITAANQCRSEGLKLRSKAAGFTERTLRPKPTPPKTTQIS